MSPDEGCTCGQPEPSLTADHKSTCALSICHRCRMDLPDHLPGDDRCHPVGTQDDRLLADLFRRALRNNLLDTRTHFFPQYHTTLEPGTLMDAQEIILTDEEIDALRRSV